MYRRSDLIGLAMLIGPLAALPGCYPTMSRVKVEVSQQSEFPAAGIQRLDVQTDNGAIVVTGIDATDQIRVDVRIEAKGSDRASASACADAIEPMMRANEDGTFHIGWQWKGDKKRDWSASVSFHIEAPKSVTVGGETHNGAIEVHDTTSACRLSTHNGAITIDATGGPFDAETRNGRIDAKVSTDQIKLLSHNGAIRVDATACEALGGKIETHNGEVGVNLGQQTRTDPKCESHNGKITRPKNNPNTTGPAPTLAIETHNGSIRVSRQSGE